MSFIKMEDVGIQAVSHSRMKTHEGCPRKAKYKFIDKMKEPGNEAMDRGLEVHKDYENWLIKFTGKECEGNGYLPNYAVSKQLEEDIKAVWHPEPDKRYDVQAEQQIAFTRNWELTSWFGQDAWMRVVLDYGAQSPDKAHMILGDYKTGKVYDDHDQQADLYALAGFKMGAERVDVKFYYCDQNLVQPYSYTIEELPGLVESVEARANIVTTDRNFPTNPSWKCRYCHFRRDNGGPCAH